MVDAIIWTMHKYECLQLHKMSPNIILEYIWLLALDQPGNSETICGHQQLRKQIHDHGKALISCDPWEFQISGNKKREVKMYKNVSRAWLRNITAYTTRTPLIDNLIFKNHVKNFSFEIIYM